MILANQEKMRFVSCSGKDPLRCFTPGHSNKSQFRRKREEKETGGKGNQRTIFEVTTKKKQRGLKKKKVLVQVLAEAQGKES